MSLDICLLGGFRILHNGQLMTGISQVRQQSLLAYLILHAHAPHSRHHVAYLFWPDSTEYQAQTNLRYFLHHLRRSFPEIEQYLRITNKMLHWAPTMQFTLDVAEFESLVHQATHAQATPNQRSTLERASSLYRGNLLPACYDEWIIPLREHLSQRYIAALDRLINLVQEQGEILTAIAYATRLLNHDPIREASYRCLMQLHALNGDRASALRIYHDCVSMLERDLGVEPSSDTRAVYERVLHKASPEHAVGLKPSSSTTAVSLTKYVGREQEWQQLKVVWDITQCGEPHLALISGEAGMGKTRLAEELVVWVSTQGIPTSRTRFYAFEGQLPFAMVAELLRSDAHHQCVELLDDVWLAELARLLPEILVKRPDLPFPQPLTDSWQRRCLFEAMARAVLSVNQPLLLHIDDLQWADQESLEWLHYLLRFDPQAHLLVVGTVRAEEIGPPHPLTSLLHALRRDDRLTLIELEPLTAAEAAALAQDVAQRELESELLAQLYEYTQGIPLFIVETVRAQLTSGAARRGSNRATDQRIIGQPAVPVAIPPKIYTLLEARLDQLSAPGHELANVAAVIGRSFSLDLLARASGMNDETVVGAMDELWQRRILREHGINEYDFSHDRIRDVAFAEIAPVRRRMMHKCVAQALELSHATNLDRVSAQIAMHYEQAGLPEQAIPYYQRAGAAAQRMYANKDAIGLIRRGLDLLKQLPDAPERALQELDLCLALAAPIRMMQGWVAPELKDVLDRSWMLAQNIGDLDQRFEILWGLCLFHAVRGELDRQHELTKQLLSLAQALNTSAHLAMATNLCAAVNLSLGAFRVAHSWFVQCANVYDAQQHQQQCARLALDHRMLPLASEPHNLWCLGYPDMARQRSRDAITFASGQAHPFSQAIAMAYAAMLHQFCREYTVTEALAKATLEVATQHEVTYYRIWGTVLLRWTLAWQRPGVEEIAALREALADFRATGAGLRWPYYLALLGQIYGRAGQYEAGLEVLAEALSTSAETNEHWWDAELYRLKGELMLAQGGDTRPEVAAAFQQALEIAHKQHAKSLELRAALSIRRLQKKHGETKDSHLMLADIYHWFKEGFDTPDLQEARSLLQMIS